MAGEQQDLKMRWLSSGQAVRLKGRLFLAYRVLFIVQKASFNHVTDEVIFV